MSRVFLVLFATLTVGCNAAPDLDPFVGTWVGRDTQSLMFSDAGAASHDVTSDVVVSIASPEKGRINATLEADAGASCMLAFSSDGSRATLLAGISCSVDGVSRNYNSGTATVNGNSLNASLAFDIAADPSQPGTNAGSGTETLGCSRYVISAPSGGGW